MSGRKVADIRIKSSLNRALKFKKIAEKRHKK